MKRAFIIVLFTITPLSRAFSQQAFQRHYYGGGNPKMTIEETATGLFTGYSNRGETMFDKEGNVRFSKHYTLFQNGMSKVQKLALSYLRIENILCESSQDFQYCIQ